MQISRMKLRESFLFFSFRVRSYPPKRTKRWRVVKAESPYVPDIFWVDSEYHGLEPQKCVLRGSFRCRVQKVTLKTKYLVVGIGRFKSTRLVPKTDGHQITAEIGVGTGNFDEIMLFEGYIRILHTFSRL